MGAIFWNGLCSRTYASGCQIQTVLKENKKYSSCKGKGRNFGCIDIIRRILGRERKEKAGKSRKLMFSDKGGVWLRDETPGNTSNHHELTSRKEGWHEGKAAEEMNK
jgi:hypothetical protein